MSAENISKNYSLVLRDRELDLSRPVIMGVLNATPDSFSDGGRFRETGAALDQIGLMVSQGATIIDIGGESTRPGSDPVPEEEELNRVLPIFEKAVPEFKSTLFSIDTTKYRVAEEALRQGAHLVNDISGLQQEPRLADLCKRYSAGYIMMHSQGNPRTMQDKPEYDDVVGDIKSFFKQKIELARSKGLETLILDPGIGFGKTLEHNIRLLRRLDEFLDLGYPLMVGVSRKSMLGHLLHDRPVDDRLTGTIVTHYHALMKGAKIIRVHDVKEANDSILVYNAIVNDEF